MSLIKLFLDGFSRKSIFWKTSILSQYFKNSEKVLDFGCGDLSLSKSLKAAFPFLQITGVDVIPFPKRPKNIKFIIYDGKTLPFKNNSFDTVIAFYVFHHSENAFASFEECVRVAKYRIIFIESVYRYSFELPFMKMMDWIYNKVKPESIALSYQFFSYGDWIKVFAKHQLRVGSSKKIKQVFLPSFFPIGISYVFEVLKKN